MRVKQERGTTTQRNDLPDRDTRGGSSSSELKKSLRTMSYDEGARALSPNGTSSEAPVQGRERQGSTSRTEGAAATQANSAAAPSTQASPSQAPAPVGASPVSAAQIWYQMPAGTTGLPPEYEAQVPVGARCIVNAFVPLDGGPAVRVFTTYPDWIAVKKAVGNQRYITAKNQADAANKAAADGKGGVQTSKLVVRVGEPDANHFATYYIMEEGLKDNDPYRWGHDDWQMPAKLAQLGWPYEEIQKLFNIQPGFQWKGPLPTKPKKGPVYKSEFKDGAPVPTKYALKHRADIPFKAWVAHWTDKTQPVD